MNLLSGLEKFGLDQMDTDHLFEEEKSDTPARKAPEPVPKKEPVHSETEFLLDKSIRCPVCDNVFRTRMVKTGRVKRMEPVLIYVRVFSTLIQINMMYRPAHSADIRR